MRWHRLEHVLIPRTMLREVLELYFTVEFSERLLRNTHVGISWGILEPYQRKVKLPNQVTSLV
jgi:hypothetical protein